MSDRSSEDPREHWCSSLARTSLAALGAAARELSVAQLRRYGYEYCYLNLLTVFGYRRTTEQLSSFAMECMRNHLFSGEEFRAYYLAARGQRPWDGEIRTLDEGIHLTSQTRLILEDLLACGSVIVCGFHWGAFRFIPVGLSSLGVPVKVILGKHGSDLYPQFTISETAEMRRRGVRNSLEKVSTIGAHREFDLLGALKSLKSKPGALFIPVDGMFGSRLSRNTVEISFADVSLGVKANPARLAKALRAPLISLFAKKEDSGKIAIEVAEVIHTDASRTFELSAMQRLYRSLEERVTACPELWEGARTFHHLRKLQPSCFPSPPPEELSAVRSAIANGRLSFNTSRVARLQMPGGEQAWVDTRTLQCFGRTPEGLKALNALGDAAQMASLWREARSQGEEGQSLIQFFGQLYAAGLLKEIPAVGTRREPTILNPDVRPGKCDEKKGGEIHEPGGNAQALCKIQRSVA